MFPRAMNNQEKEALKIVKESGLSYDIKYDYSPYSGGYTVNVPVLCGTFYLCQIRHFYQALKRYQSKEQTGNKHERDS